MPRFLLSAAAALVFTLAATAQQATAGKVPGLHIHAIPPAGYGRPRVPRVVRNFNPKQQVQTPKQPISPAPRRRSL
jgi:hypothetical protein